MTFTVTCPECSHTRQTSPEKIPPGRIKAICPRCRTSFPFTAHLEPLPASAAAVAPLAPPLASPGDSPTGETPPAAIETRSAALKRATHRFVFSGTAGEYFGIWIVNLLLKVVTFGIYTAWAKVRKRRYFYGSTLLDDAPFAYTADPMAIFRGWCLGAAAFVVYSIGTQVSPTLGMIFGIAIFLGVPWVIVRARMFGARNSTYRNIRFTFRPNYREAYVVFAGLSLLVPFTLGLILPYIVYRQKKFQVENSGYGSTDFTFTATAGDFYRFFLKVGLGLLLLLSAMGAISTLVGLPLGGLGQPAAFGVLFPAMILAAVALYFFVVVYVQTELSNMTWNATRLGEVRLASKLRTRDMAWLYFSSAVAIFCSFGLLVPWAAVRLARYRFERLAVSMAGAPRILAAEQPAVGAAGEEFGDIFGIEVGLG
ncbi:MAG: DUF898 family protein [Desulfuromonadales bacterium]